MSKYYNQLKLRNLLRKELLVICLSFLNQITEGQFIPRLDWATYHGGNLNDALRDMAIDGAGNIYIIGVSSSQNAIATAGSYQPVIAGANDVYLAKYSNTGVKLWATYYGGGSDDIGQSIDLDTQGNVFITGLTLSVGGISSGAVHKTLYNGGGDVFVAKFSNSGTRIWGTYFGGSDFDFANDLEVDNSGNVIITGWTGSNSGISTPGAHQSTYSDKEDVMVAKFTNNGQLSWATYYGDTGFERGLQVESDGVGNIVISGWTSSVVNFASAGAHQTNYGGATADAFVGKFTPGGMRMWMTYCGGIAEEYSDALAVTQDGRIYLGGSSNSPNAIATAGSYQTTLSGSFDAILVHFNTNGQRVWATYFGGSDHDTGYRLREGSDGAIYMTGHTRSSDRMSTTNALQPSNSGGWDAFLAKFEISGNRSWSTYYGGSSDDFSYGLVLDSKNDVFITGLTKGSTNLSTPGAAQVTFGGGSEDGFIAKFAPCPKNFALISSNNSPVCTGKSLDISASGGISYTWVGPNGFSSSNQNLTLTNPSVLNSGRYTVTVTDMNSCSDTISSLVTVHSLPVVTTSSNSPVCAGNQLNLNATGGISYFWSGANGFANNNQNPVVQSATSLNSGTYTVTVRDTNNCTSTSNINVTINQPPAVSFSSNSPVCQGSSLNLTAGGGSTYSWAGPNGFTSSQQNAVVPTTAMLNTGMYTVTVTATNTCTTTASIIVTINSTPNIILTSNSPVCTDDTIKFTVSGGNTFSWNGPAGFNTNIQNPTLIKAAMVNMGTYSLTVSDITGCTASKSINITVKPKPIVSILGADTICFGEDIKLSTLSQGNLLWSNGQSSISISVRPIINTKYTLTSNLNGCLDSASVTIGVKSRPVLTISPPVTIQNGANSKLSASGADIWKWRPAESLSCSDCPAPTAGPSVTTTYCVVGTRNECTAESCVTIDVNQQCEIILPNIVTPNGDGTNDRWCSPSKPCIINQMVKIFDRWGNLLFTTAGDGVCWDIQSDNPQIQNQVVSYILQIETLTGNTEFKTGDILISK